MFFLWPRVYCWHQISEVAFQKLICYLFLAVPGLPCRAWASRCGGFSHAEHRLAAQASVGAVHRLQSTGPVVVVRWLSCPMACRILLDQGLNPCPLH